MRIIKAIRNAKRLEKENAELRKAIEEALQDLQDSECPLGVRALSASIRLERALEKDSEERQLSRIPKNNSLSQPYCKAEWEENQA